MKDITVCITSCNRFALLKQAIESLLNLNTYPISRIVVIEDSGKLEIKDKILNSFSNKIELIFNEINIGQIKSIDKVYKTVDTPYILHIEDDYNFVGNTNFIQNSIDILSERTDVHQIWIRHMDDFIPTHTQVFNDAAFSSEILSTTNGVMYKMVSLHFGWCGFTFNPSIKRTEDYHRVFPNGFEEFMAPGFQGNLSEAQCDRHAGKNNWRAAILINGACYNMGNSHKLSTYG